MTETAEWAPTQDTQSPDRCANCNEKVTLQFRRVCGDNDNRAHACPECATYREIQEGHAARKGGLR